MDLTILKEVNDLWDRIYPYLAAQVMEHYGKSRGDVLELGPFAGGISTELARLQPAFDITLADQDAGTVDFLRKGMEGPVPGRRVQFRCTPLENLAFEDSLFDLVVFRGAYFFLDEEGRILRQIFRVLRKEGLAFVGGGYGKGTPQALIDEIAERSRDLNDRLGRKRVTVEEVMSMVDRSGLSGHAGIEKDGGLWVILKK
ncbi:MAG: class I SAM-dependent methyltransferase [Deltaproteobacteria bacterium]|nr:class I SAM-dependent methyltransferase [Deltaproteobacteria bacterium]